MDAQVVNVNEDSKEEKKGIPGSTLKIIAIVTMFIDHIGAVVLERFVEEGTFLYVLDRILRGVGRVAFPIFCFLLVEGFFHTRNKIKYAQRLAAFAVISEIPFDLATSGSLINLGYQNVFFTLLIGFLTICALDKLKKWELQSGRTKRVIKWLFTIVIMAAGIVAAHFLKTDYSFGGVLAVVVMYSLHVQRQTAMLGGWLVLTAYNLYEVFAIVDVFLIKLYNGERGLKLKYIFYAFYPVHLLVLYFVAVAIGAA